MNYIDEERKPDVFGPGSVLLAALLHALFFGVLYFGGQFSFREDKVIIPIDLTVVMQENLDGDENEPPPVPDVKPPEPEPEPPKPPEPKPPEPKPPEPEPPKPVDPPPAVEHDPPVKTNEVAEVKPPEPPKKTAAELRAERLAAMVARTTKLPDMPKPPKPRATNGKTGPKTLSDEEIAKLLALGYKPGAEEVIATDEMTRCVSLVKMALEEKQDLLHPEMGAEGKVHLTIRFDRTGRVRSPSLTQSCGDAKTDAAALRIVRSLDTIRGLSSAFLDEFSKNPLTIEYTMSKRR